MEQSIIGQKQMVNRLIIGLLATAICCWKGCPDWPRPKSVPRS
jgi:hypothetical protein